MNRVMTAHLDSSKQMCLFTDASDAHFAAVLTQVPPEDLKLPREEQRHEPLSFYSGSFKGALFNWSTFEKEAFAVIEAMERLDYLTLTGRVRVFTDHLNLIYVYDPTSVVPTIARHVLGKVQRWGIRLSNFDYEVEHVPGVKHDWPDLLSRWGFPAGAVSQAVRRLMLAPIRSPITDEHVSDLISRVLQAQALFTTEETSAPDVSWDQDRACWTRGGLILVPSKAVDICLSILLVAHCARAGHKNALLTKRMIREVFDWPHLVQDVEAFCNSCLVCQAMKGPHRVMRQMAHQLHASRPGELLHFDFLYIGESAAGYKYILVLKDDFSNFIRLALCKFADGAETIGAMLEYFRAYGVVPNWISDQGRHFVNDLVKKVSARLRCSHSFTTSYAPWANGTIEVANRSVLQALRILCQEHQAPFELWPDYCPLVEAIVNSHPSPKLGGKSPFEVFLNRPSETPFMTAAREEPELLSSPNAVAARQAVDMHNLSEAFEKISKDVSVSADDARKTAIARHNARTGVQPVNFDVGDFVLVGSVQREKLHKLAALWTGPYQVTAWHNAQVAVVKHLLSSKERLIHTTRLKHYQAKWEKKTEELEDLLHYQDATLFVVEKILDIRAESGRIELLTSWVGFPGEDTWEPLLRLHSDVPDLVRAYCDESGSPVAQQALNIINKKLANNRKRAATGAQSPRKRRRPRR